MKSLLHIALAAACLVTLGCGAPTEDTAPAVDAPPPPEGTDTHNVDVLAPGVYFLHEAGAVTVMSNALVIENEDDVVVVDSNVTPQAAEGLLNTIAGITSKPISYLINSHYHFDHAHGNQAFPPGVLIVGHEYTRERLAAEDALDDATFVDFKQLFRGNLETMASDHATAEGSGDGATALALTQQMTLLQAHIEAMDTVVATPPTVTLEDRLTLHRGSREIQLLHVGRGHTGGDVVVYLPAEKILFTGDLLVAGPSYMGDAFVDEWVETLDRIKEIPFETIAPGHGMPFTDRSLIDKVQKYYADLWDTTVAMRADGVSALEAALRVDMSAHQGDLGQFASPLLPGGILEPGIYPAAVMRIYDLLDERGE
ncbi:MAG: MBL fold metallo-hydrolase [Acidobacteriota bacterium]|nr:MBL fold metallo-hydrolase [Acidobacteriota bacterium]